MTGSWGLYLNTCISSGEFCTSSWRRCQRRQALSSCCSWASWGASCLEHRHTNTHAQNTVTVVLYGVSRQWSGGLCFGGDGTDSPHCALCPTRKVQGQRGLSGLQTKNRPSLPRCLLGRCPLVRQPPHLPLSALPWREQTSLGASFHSDSFQPCLALSFRTGWERSPPFTSYFFPAPSFVKGCLQWSLLM